MESQSVIFFIKGKCHLSQLRHLMGAWLIQTLFNAGLFNWSATRDPWKASMWLMGSHQATTPPISSSFHGCQERARVPEMHGKAKLPTLQEVDSCSWESGGRYCARGRGNWAELSCLQRRRGCPWGYNGELNSPQSRGLEPGESQPTSTDNIWSLGLWLLSGVRLPRS